MTSSERRNPRQQRSLERVQAILDTASELIVEQGGASLKMATIAQRAGVTTGSIYQYFPNTGAITRALAEDYAERYRAVLKQHLEQIDSAAELINHGKRLFSALYDMYRSDPVLKEIGLMTSIDRSLQSMDILDSRHNAELLFEAYRAFFEPSVQEELRRLLFLMCHLSGSAIRLSLALDAEEGDALLLTHQQMIQSRIAELMLG